MGAGSCRSNILVMAGMVAWSEAGIRGLRKRACGEGRFPSPIVTWLSVTVIFSTITSGATGRANIVGDITGGDIIGGDISVGERASGCIMGCTAISVITGLSQYSSISASGDTALGGDSGTVSRTGFTAGNKAA